MWCHRLLSASIANPPAHDATKPDGLVEVLIASACAPLGIRIMSPTVTSAGGSSNGSVSDDKTDIGAIERLNRMACNT
jgi:hypothetical protein